MTNEWGDEEDFDSEIIKQLEWEHKWQPRIALVLAALIFAAAILAYFYGR